MRNQKNSKNHVFLNRNGEHIVGYLFHLNKIKPNEKSKTTQNWSKSNGISKCICSTICKIFYNLLHKMCMS
jgi:hypothetical protein